MVHIIDSEKCFNKDIAPYHLKQGEFDVLKPYFSARKDGEQLEIDEQHRSVKKRKKSAKQPALSETDKKTKERHDELRIHLTDCLEQLPQLWPKSVKTETPCAGRGNDDASIPEAIDFPAIQKMVEATQARFTNVMLEEAADGEEVVTEIFEFISPITTELDIFSVFHTVCTNRAVKEVKLLQLTPTATYLLPPRSTFLMGSLASSINRLKNHIASVGGADIIVIDPPWPNKSVHRSSHYETQDIYDLFKIPIAAMTEPKDSIVAVWITNKPKFRNFIIQKLFPAWQLECVAEWIWLKVTTQAECVLPLDSGHKKPYEQLIIGRPVKLKESKIRIPIPQSKVIVSVPSVRHSRKPPLEDALSPYISKENISNPVYVELFARCLMPGWISWGNECLKFQDISYFKKDCEADAADSDSKSI